MLNDITCRGELHLVGGEGSVWLAEVASAAPRLLSVYGGAARMVYADPPFGTGGSFEFRRGKKQVAYTDKLSREEYRAMIENTAKLAHGLLTDDGTFFLHIDYRMSALCRGVCDEVFGEEALANEIIWAYKSGGRSQKSFSKKHDTILMYRKSPNAYFNIEAVGTARGPVRRNHMRRGIDEDGRMFYSIRTGGREYRYYDDDPVYPSDVWDDIEHLHQRDPERTGFVTQKPEALLRRMILCCSEEGDLIADLFGGSGTGASAAAALGRRFVTVDRGAASLAVMRSRLVERGLGRPIYEGAKPFTVEYDSEPEGEPPHALDYFDVTESEGRLTLTLKELPKEKAPYYAATGYVENGVFIAEDYMPTGSKRAKLGLKNGGALHIVGEDMNGGFCEYRAGE